MSLGSTITKPTPPQTSANCGPLQAWLRTYVIVFDCTKSSSGQTQSTYFKPQKRIERGPFLPIFFRIADLIRLFFTIHLIWFNPTLWLMQIKHNWSNTGKGNYQIPFEGEKCTYVLLEQFPKIMDIETTLYQPEGCLYCNTTSTSGRLLHTAQRSNAVDQLEKEKSILSK